MKLSKKSAAEIASLFNSLHVSSTMRESSIARGDQESWKLWWKSAQEAAIALHDKYGIECVNYKNYISTEG
jgi:hypothetical protein